MQGAMQGVGASLQGPPSVSPARFVPAGFKYNANVAVALVPSLVVLALSGGRAVAGVLVVGFMGMYILDAVRFKEGAFFANWLTMGVANLALVFSGLLMGSELPFVLSLLGFLLGGATLLLTGLWVTLQFKWIQLQYPAVVMAFERLLLSGSVPVGAAVITWGLVPVAGAAATPYFLAATLCTLYYLCALPLPSSFQLAPRRAPAGGPQKPPVAQARADAALSFLLVVALPAGTYTAIHAAVLFEWVHFWSLLLLSTGPLLFVTSLKGEPVLPHGLWWLGRGSTAEGARLVLLLVSLAGFLAGLEGRVVFYSLGQYIRLAAPWSYLAVTVALYGGAAIVLLHVAGAIDEGAEAVLFGPLLMLSASLASVAVGLPLWVLPAPLLAAFGLALFYETRSFRDYFLFLAGGLATAAWFLWHHFGFLDVSLDGVPLRTLCGLLLAAALPALALPGLVQAGAPAGLVGGTLVAQSVLLAWLEEHLYAGDHQDVTHGLHPMYPPWLVVATSGLGGLMARRLADIGAAGRLSAYVAVCVYAAKAAMLIVPEARLLVPTAVLLLATLHPLLLPPGGGAAAPGRRRELAPWQGALAALFVLLAVAAARFAVYDVSYVVLGRRPSEALLLGCLLLAAAVGLAPLVSTYCPASPRARRALLLLAAGGLLLALLRPPLPVRGGAKCPKGLPLGLCPRLWNEEHVPEHEMDDVTIYGDGLRRREHWPLWLLVGAAFFGLLSMTSGRPGRGGVGVRLAEAAVGAGLAGAYLALEFFPAQPLLQGLVLGTALVCAAFLVLLQTPTSGGPVLMVALALGWAASFPAALLLQAAAALPPLPEGAQRLFPDGAWGVDHERRAAMRSAVLAVYAAEALLLAFGLKLRVSAALAGLAGPRPRLPGSGSGLLGGVPLALDQAAGFLGQCMPMHVLAPGAGRPALRGAGGVALQRLSGEGLGWVPTAANMLTLFCFATALALNYQLVGGADAAILVLAPVLLLLGQDPVLLRTLSDERRYFPPALAAGGYLAASAGGALLDAWRAGPDAFAGGAVEAGVFVLRNGACLAACLPAQADLLLFLWRRARLPAARLLVLAGLGAAGALASELDAVRLLGGLGLVGAAVQVAAGQHTRHVGRKII